MNKILICGFCTIALVSCTQSYNAQIVYPDESVKEVPFSAKNDSLANLYGFQKFVDALNDFEQTDGNKDNLQDIDYNKMPKSVKIFKTNGNVDVTNLTSEIKNEGMKTYVPSEKRLAAEKAKKQYTDSLASFAWGDLKFGLSKSEVNATSQFHPLHLEEWGSFDFGENEFDYSVPKEYNKIVAAKLGLDCKPKLILSFWGNESNELYKVRLETDYDKETNHYQLKKDCKKLISVVTAKYGKEYMTFNRFDKIKNSEWVKDNTIARWDIGNKKITLEVMEYQGDIKYLLLIRNNQYPQKKENVPESML